MKLIKKKKPVKQSGPQMLADLADYTDQCLATVLESEAKFLEARWPPPPGATEASIQQWHIIHDYLLWRASHLRNKPTLN